MAPPASRPYQGLLVGLHLLAAVGFLYKLRVEPGLNNVPEHFDEVVEAATFPNGLPLKTTYFGVPAIDQVFPWLVVAFVAGPAGWDINVRLEQMHFLYNFASILAVLVVESRRVANAQRITTWIALWAVFYQTVGGAFIVPLWFAVDLMTSNDADRSRLAAKRDVPLPYAQFVLPATILGYLLPTALLYVPWGWSHEVSQILTAFWQPAPLLVSLFLVLFANAAMSLSVTTSAAGPTSHAGFPNARDGPPRDTVPGGDMTPPDDVFYLKTYYAMVGMLCFVVHAYVLYQIQTGGYAELIASAAAAGGGPGGAVTFSSVFLPSKDLWKTSLAAGLHYIFQWDEIGIFGTALTWSWVKTWDIQRAAAATRGGVSGAALARSAVLITLANVLVGPGATIMAIWFWRENKLVEMAAAQPGTTEAKKLR
ncbi:hypothetical protein Micbo1qcDRAFT_195904 [Microdochium bolleyi]|uniref:Uncharacterized protein n=1 Tax=Microdochium bolleyi TaxID=196109 RepID=A0A136J1R6_9PEZI|nr:hypothetical protein Micbo1qcDRAFT_195904 [Microdochium bolleyi]